MSAPVVVINDGSADTLLEVHTVTSAKAFSAILLQKLAAAKHLHPIAYYIKKFNNY